MAVIIPLPFIKTDVIFYGNGEKQYNILYAGHRLEVKKTGEYWRIFTPMKDTECYKSRVKDAKDAILMAKELIQYEVSG